MSDPRSYEFVLRVLGNEVFAVKLNTSNDSNKWVAISVVTIFCILTVLGAYGEKLVTLYNSLIP